jgi:hypothetical protein
MVKQTYGEWIGITTVNTIVLTDSTVGLSCNDYVIILEEKTDQVANFFSPIPGRDFQDSYAPGLMI